VQTAERVRSTRRNIHEEKRKTVIPSHSGERHTRGEEDKGDRDVERGEREREREEKEREKTPTTYIYNLQTGDPQLFRGSAGALAS
jgi:hypothetical protein